MAFLERSSPRVRASALLLAVLALLFLLSVALVAQQADAAVERLVRLVSPWAKVTHERVSVTPGGTLVLHDVRIVSTKNPGASLAAVKVDVTPPGPIWLLRAAFGTGDAMPPVDRFLVRMHEVTYQGSGAVFPALEYVGWASGAPFEALGCGSLTTLTRSELLNMGLRIGAATADFHYTAKKGDGVGKGEGIVSAFLSVPGSSTMRYLGTRRFADPTRPLDSGAQALVGEAWKVDDAGFVTARNRWCAQRQRTTRNLVVNAHVAAIASKLEAHDVTADPALVDAYRRYASRGGQLEVAFRPATPIDVASLGKLDWIARAERLGARLSVAGREVPIVLHPLLVDDFVGPPELPAVGAPTEVATTAATATPPSPAVTPAVPTAGAPTTPATQVAEHAVTPATDSSTAGPADSSAPVPSLPEPPSPEPRQTASAPARPAQAPSPPPEGPSAGKKRATAPLKLGEVTYRELAGAIDRAVVVDTVFNSRRSGVLRDYNGEAITLEIEERGGLMLVTLPKATVVRAEVTSARIIPKSPLPKPDAEEN